MHSPCFPFNIRVYGLLINSKQEVLLTDEYRMETYMTKFPGGGMEYGEGTIDCLKREFKEELNIDISIDRHFYTTDYFQPAYFFEKMQMMSIYYLVSCNNTDSIPTTTIANHIPAIEGKQAFRWAKIESLKAEDLTLPIDKKVVEMLRNEKV
jgi:ADP-ribose pyrophosphatase YjhB (NUDIX family)